MTLTQVTVARRFEPDRCANCFEPLPASYEHRPWLFCSVLCRETANTVRYWRKTSRNGQFEADPEVRQAIGIRLAHMLAGGYNADTRRIPVDVRALVIERDRACVKCGGPGEEIDHINGDSSDSGNLQLLCKNCHHAKTAERLVPASDEQSDRIFAMLVERVIPCCIRGWHRRPLQTSTKMTTMTATSITTPGSARTAITSRSKLLAFNEFAGASSTGWLRASCVRDSHGHRGLVSVSDGLQEPLTGERVTAQSEGP